MNAKFNIYQSCTDRDRPPIPYRVREYFVQFITDKVLMEKRLVVNGKWNVVLAIFFLAEGGRYKSRNIFLAKGEPRSVKEEMIKLYEIIIPLKLIQEANNPYLRTIELMYEAIKIFLTTTYKKVTPEFMDELWKQVDVDYLLSLPYPAPLSEQKYVGDRIMPNGEVEVLKF